ncbi:12359_t:CDS:2, partial [Gigaspora rosea]
DAGELFGNYSPIVEEINLEIPRLHKCGVVALMIIDNFSNVTIPNPALEYWSNSMDNTTR